MTVSTLSINSEKLGRLVGSSLQHSFINSYLLKKGDKCEKFLKFCGSNFAKNDTTVVQFEMNIRAKTRRFDVII